MKSKMLSIILLSYYSGDKISSVYFELKKILDNENIPFELIVIDDASQDNSFSIAIDLEQKEENVRAYQLSKNVTSHYSIFAGLSQCKGACAIPIPDDEQQPYDSIVSMYRLWEKGEKVIIPFRKTRNDGWFSNAISDFFYRIMTRYSEIKFPKGGADIFFIDRELIDLMNTKIRPIRTTSITEVLRLGFNPYFLPYKRPTGNNKKSRWTLKKKLRLASDFLFSSSTFPIKIISGLGFFFSLFSFALIFFYSILYFFGDKTGLHLNKIPGWTSTIVFIAFFSGLILFSLGIIAHYIWIIYEEVKDRPGYIIKNKTNDSNNN
jgi:glycosyltransferase involved in cell wall biosynthesis